MTEYSGESGRRADPQPIIDKILGIERKAGYDGGENRSKSLSWDNSDHRAMVLERFRQNGEVDLPILPGFGPRGDGANARDDCGEPHPFVCDSCGHTVEFGRTCSQSVCARCAPTWARDLSIKKSAKLRRLRKEKNHHTPDHEHQKFHHMVLSPRLGWYHTLARAGKTLEEAKEITRNVVKFILEEMRAQGEVARHSYRGQNDDGTVKSESDDRGAWKERLNSDRNWYGDVRNELAWKPHYHAVVVSDFLRGDGFTDRIEQKTGWVLHRIADENGVSVPNDGAMARLLTYSLSHTDIHVNEDGPNRSAVWQVGAFAGDAYKSSSRFTAKPSDLEWSDGVVRRVAPETLGLQSGTTECGASIPAVDEPDELARRVSRILDGLSPGEEQTDVDTDLVLHHISEGNLSVDVATTTGGGGDVTVRDAFGEPIGSGGMDGSLPQPSSSSKLFDGAEEPHPSELEDTDTEDCGCGDNHGGSSEGGECDGRLVPLGEVRNRGLLEDVDWCANAPHVDEAQEADREWDDGLDPWRSSSPGKTLGIG